MFRAGFFLLAAAALLAAKSPEWDRAHDLYQRTEYKQALEALQPISNKDTDVYELMGRSYYGLADYKKSVEMFEKASSMPAQDPKQAAEIYHWLGRAYGRRAETSSFITAPSFASKTRQMLEKSVQLDATNQEAVNDLFDYYLQAPGFLGGGIQKAEELAKHIASLDAAEGYYAQAQIDDKRKEYSAAEQHLRRAAELAPKQVGRVVDLAKYLANRGRLNESDAMFQEAIKMAPNKASLLFARAELYIQQKRNLSDARQLLQQYLKASLTPDDPPRERAQELLKQIP
jgi:tetratricopeptide (TPR) repeat protein